MLARHRYPAAHRRADARAPRGRRGRLARPASTRRAPVSTPRRSAAASAASAAREPAYGTSEAKISAWRSSQSASAKRSTARRRAAADEALAIRQHAGDRLRQRLRRRRLVPLEAVRVRHADPRLVADELDGAAARGVRDGNAARHRLDHRRRARVVDLRVEEDVRAAEEAGRLGLRVPAREVDGVPEPESARASARDPRRAAR